MSDAEALYAASLQPPTPAPRADIKTDRIFCCLGGSIKAFYNTLSHPRDAAHTRVILTHIEDSPQEIAALAGGHPLYPRDSEIGVSHECVIGTVDEIVADFRAKLTKAFNVLTMQIDEHGDLRTEPVIIPSMGTTDLAPWKEVLARHGIDKFTVLPHVTPERLAELEARRQG